MPGLFCHSATCLADWERLGWPLLLCSILLVVGTPTQRPEDVARLARAYYHADLQLIDETSMRGEDGRWRYRDPRLQRLADALTRAELTQCAHHNRPRFFDGRVVVTLYADEILYLPVMTEISSLPQLTRGATAARAGASKCGTGAHGQRLSGAGATRRGSDVTRAGRGGRYFAEYGVYLGPPARGGRSGRCIHSISSAREIFYR